MITKSFVSYLFAILRKILRSLSSSKINESADASSSKFFACKEKKKVEFQYRNDESKEEDTENSFESKKDSEYFKSSEKDESVNDDKKEL